MTRTWRITIVAVTLPVAMLAVACSNKGGKSTTKTTTKVSSLPNEAKTLKTVAQGKLTACTATADPPFYFDEAGRPGGVDAELVRALGGRMGLTADFVPGPAAQAIDQLKAGKCDIAVAALVISDSLKQQVDFSSPYLPLAPAIVAKKADAGTYKTSAALKGKTVGVIGGSSVAADIDRDSRTAGYTTTTYADVDKALAALKSGAVAAVLTEVAPVAAKIKDSNDFAVAGLIKDQQTGGYGVATRKGDSALQQAVSNALTQVKADDTYRNVMAPYLGDAANLIAQ